MNLREIKEELLMAAELVGDFEQRHLEIDRDTALNKIRQAYEALRFVDATFVKDAPASADSVCESEQDDCEPEIEVEFLLSDESESIAADSFEPLEESVEEIETVADVAEPEPEVETEPEPEVVAEPEVDVVEEPVQEPMVESVSEPAPESAPEPTQELEEEPIPEPKPTHRRSKRVVEPSLFGDFDGWNTQTTSSHSKLMALYDDEPTVEQPKAAESKAAEVVVPKVEVEHPKVEVKQPEVVEATPKIEVKAESKQVLGETITATTTIADTITPVASVAEDQAVDSLRGSISVVDRFMLIRDLFGDDAALYERTISALDEMDNLDDCIIYIAENFIWRPSADGTKLIMDLLQRKFK